MGPDSEYAIIPLTQGKFAIISLCDWGKVADRSWCAEKPTKKRKAWRASGALSRLSGRQRHILMHRFILGITDSSVGIDHSNGDGLDNRRSNLRIATTSQNIANTPVSKRNKLGVKGVFKMPNGLFRAYLARTHLGCFSSIEEASQTYQKAHLKMYGEYSVFSRGGVPSEVQ